MFYNIILFIMNTKVKIKNLSEKEMVMNFAGANWAESICAVVRSAVSPWSRSLYATN